MSGAAKHGGRRRGAGSKPNLVKRVRAVRWLANEHRLKFELVEIEAYRDELAAALAEVSELLPAGEAWGGEVL